MLYSIGMKDGPVAKLGPQQRAGPVPWARPRVLVARSGRNSHLIIEDSRKVYILIGALLEARENISATHTE